MKRRIKESEEGGLWKRGERMFQETEGQNAIGSLHNSDDFIYDLIIKKQVKVCEVYCSSKTFSVLCFVYSCFIIISENGWIVYVKML